uniref:Uncharacterized protein n=1 Tax=uncultured marine group II/III euryarchaeote KM3_87_B04 TaxID=1456530 RepID=A0A075HT64_9EURY|nr:hypothetical protein [uncultured marine group II/III euryarchaeote KM3_87_B04]
MLVDEGIRQLLDNRRFELPRNHPAHRRMRELLMTEVEITEFESFEQETNREQVRWNHHRLEELGLITTRPPQGLISKNGSRPAWYLFGQEEQKESDVNEGQHSELEQYELQMDLNRLIANRAPLAAALATDGTEALAWYIPFHDTSSEWGIYIRDIGPRIIANRCFPALLKTDPNEALGLAFDFLFAHEFFHHISEIACTTLENADLSDPLYRLYFDRLVSGNPDEVLEEALANSFALNFISGKQNKDAIRRFMDDCPPGYRDYGEFESEPNFEKGLNWLASMFTGKRFDRSNSYTFGHGLFHHPKRIFTRMEVPLHDVTDISPCAPALPMCIFKNISVLPNVSEKIGNKKTPPDVKKQFKKSMNRLRDWGRVERNRRWNKTARKSWFFWDITKSWRMSFVEEKPGHWVVNFIGNHTEYDRFRIKNNLN